MKRLAVYLTIFLALAACRQDGADLPPPVTMDEDALGYYCQMNMTEHPGPKAQVHLEGTPYPLFFAQVRDAIAYQRMPEQDAVVVGIYVSDMSHADNWDTPGNDNWMRAPDAFYVVGSDAVGGMGAHELVPFSRQEDASAFAQEHGGKVVRLAEVADSDVLAPENSDPVSDEDADYQQRLQSLSQ